MPGVLPMAALGAVGTAPIHRKFRLVHRAKEAFHALFIASVNRRVIARASRMRRSRVDPGPLLLSRTG